MFSITTMELSTNIPIPSDNPDNVMILSDNPVKYIKVIVKSTDSGILMPTMIVGRTSRRKIASTMIASKAPSAILSSRSCTMIEMYSP